MHAQEPNAQTDPAALHRKVYRAELLRNLARQPLAEAMRVAEDDRSRADIAICALIYIEHRIMFSLDMLGGLASAW